MSDESLVTYHRGDDSGILQASQRARDSFRFFWYQVAQDFNRIMPALGMACVKVAFSDDFSDPDSNVEHMWVDEVKFDGVEIQGVLVNEPNWLTSVAQGDEVAFPIARLGDWMCVLGEHVYGGFTIQVIRSRMSEQERSEHDDAWGLPFPSPETVLVPERDTKFESSIANLVKEQLEKEPDTVDDTFEAGRTLLHLSALYGRTASVEVMLEKGASPTARCERGWTPLDYARALDWEDIIQVLESRG